MNKRKSVFVRDNGVCQLCGVKLHIDKERCNDSHYVQLDHIKPKSTGGNNGIDNLQATCKSCNSSKGARSGENLLKTILNSVDNTDLEKTRRFERLKEDFENGIISKDDIENIKNEYKNNAMKNIYILDILVNEYE